MPVANICSICGTTLPADDATGLCPVCLLRNALDPGGMGDSLVTEGVLGESVASTAKFDPRRFGHYEILTRPDGSLEELGHGSMGITFKAVDINLRVRVTLKVLNLRLFQEESARRRFLREARAAASVRHPNVASVYHLGARGREIFYAMEFVEGETLDALIRRSGRLEVNVALEIVAQVAAGLGAVHKQNLVHRDIKPTNIMVRLEEGSIGIVKIIDLGLAKVVDKPYGEASISSPGSFAGTPEFASPEQFAGISVDIRSDLYSLGVTLWVTLTGKPPFKGTPAEVMHQHLHAPVPLKELKGIPQPVAVLLETLLEKDPPRRFQSPIELLKALPIVTGAIEQGGTIDRQSFQQVPEGRAKSHQKAPQNLSASDLYLRGMALVELLDRDANQKAIEFFKRATKQDPNFALAYIGLARAYVEEQGFGGKKSLLDSAVKLCRLAIALDPGEVRGYDQLARAYYSKGWYPQCDEALQKALELGSDDGRSNALAARRALAKQQFGESYKYFRKAHTLNANESRWVYVAAEIIFRMDLDDVAEKWMQAALEREANPQRHQMMECYRMMWRRKFGAARVGFAQLPLELKDYNYSVSDGLFFCAVGAGDWTTVIQYCNDYLKKGPEKIWARTYLGIALQMSGQRTEAREVGTQVLSLGLERLDQPAQPDAPWDVPLYVAWSYRLLDDKSKAYCHLERYLAQRTLLEIPLGLDNPILIVFKDDPEFGTILTEINQKFEIARRSIREHEATSDKTVSASVRE
jgi:serine/threonine protein kinase